MRVAILTVLAVASLANAVQAGTCRTNLGQFSQLKEGMTYQQVVGILGCQGEQQSEFSFDGWTSQSFGWDGNGMFSSMSASFNNGRLSSKMQFGLE